MNLTAVGALQEAKEGIRESSNLVEAQAWYEGFAFGLREGGAINERDRDELLGQISNFTKEETQRRFNHERNNNT